MSSADSDHQFFARPPQFGYTLRALANLPHRLLNPPPVRPVGSFAVTPPFHVSLSDVLDGKHCAPLGLRDFEKYLVFVERSAQNLYFILWLRAYVAKYEEWKHGAHSNSHYSFDSAPSIADSSFQSSHQLAYFFSRAKYTFFSSESQLELNLPQDLIEPFTRPPPPFRVPSSVPSYAHPRPALLDPIKVEVESMLQNSLDHFVSSSIPNMGSQRYRFGVIVGTTMFFLAFIPYFLSIFDGRPRRTRIAGLVLMWFGIWAFLTCRNGICIGIFAFGDARQMLPWELARPEISPPCDTSTPSFPLAPVPTITHPRAVYDPRRFSHYSYASNYHEDEETRIGFDRSESAHCDPEKVSIASSDHGIIISEAFPAEFEGFAASLPTSSRIATDRPITANTIKSQSSRKGSSSDQANYDRFPSRAPPIPSAPPMLFDFEAVAKLPSTPSPVNPRAVPIFASLTPVYSPIIVRAHWEIMIRSFVYATIVSVSIGALLISIPPLQHGS
ncbi:hypothetical protein BOTBODRAFT_57318 [Botryobasidium botryosum FD-172 SS1]|uniref:RGS domain-containing protein n=1 Tax=Botryobasidium botryosum (strain FD-172 SS1) TaxID=930990 RepID=A0A067MI16_BOTB1|nr:hypothetical protein BOTBODRAFT_57318 [Botryobasidium botryosum FD-172 SS1]